MFVQTSLQEKLTAAEERLSRTTEQNRQGMDELNHQLQEARLEHQSAEGKCRHLEAAVAETGDSLQAALQRETVMKEEVKSKVWRMGMGASADVGRRYML